MKEKECKLIQDLLPNYIEKLTSEETNKVIEMHLKECTECSKTLDELKKDIELQPKEQCQKETKYMKKFSNKLRTISLILFIIIIIIITVIARKILILNDLSKKAEKFDIKPNTDNYQITVIAVTGDKIIHINEYTKDSKKIRYIDIYSKTKNEKLNSLIEYQTDNECFSLSDNGESKIKQNSNSIGKLGITNTKQAISCSLDTAIWSRIQKIKFRSKESYLIQQYGNEFIIEADTGILIRYTSNFGDDLSIQDYYIQTNKVQDTDVIRPDTTGYTEK